MVINHLFLFLIILANISQCLLLKLRSIQSNIYLTSSFDYCMRYLTKDSLTGCSSKSSGNRGRLIDITSLNDLKSYSSAYPIIILIPARKDILDYAIFAVPTVVGILIDGQTMNITDDYFTEMGNCPENFNSSSTCTIRKNKYGIHFRGKFIDKPIFLLTNQTAIEQIRNASRLYNQQDISKGKYVDAHMKSYPYAVKNGEICNRRSKPTYFGEAYFKHYSIKCRSPMINIVWSVFNTISIKNPRPSKSVIIFYTKFDFFSIFQPKNAGVQSTGFSVITLLGLAWVLGRINLSQLLISNKNNKDLVLLFLNGENWNSYGKLQFNKLFLEKNFPNFTEKSSNQNNLHPIESEHIDIMINLDQLGINHDKTYILYDNDHPFINLFNTHYSSPITLQKFPETFDSLSDFQSLNISTLAMLTNAYEDMNPYYNSYHDILKNIKSDYSLIETHIYSLVKILCHYWNLTTCVSDLPLNLKQSLTDRIASLFDCFFQLNCTNLITKTNETGEFYFKEVLDNMKENFSFLQPFLHQSDIKTYINQHFLDASSYIHDILLNWISIRTVNMTKTTCEQSEEIFHYKIYQESTNTCLTSSVNSINLIRNTDELIDNRIIFQSNSDQPELLVYLINNTKRDLIIFICGLILLVCGCILSYLLPILFKKIDQF